MDSHIEARLSGTRDIFPEDHKYLTFLKKVFRHEFRKNGFRRISTPLLEETSLLRKVYPQENNRYGLYHFHNKNDIDVSLVPAATVWIMRAYIENEKFTELQPLYYYYIERSFRQNRSKKEFYSIWGEIIGESDPIIDAQSVYMLCTAFKKIGIKDISVKVNIYWIAKETEKYFDELIGFLDNKKGVMSAGLREVFMKNPLELFHSSDEDDKILAGGAPHMKKFLKKDSKKYYEGFLWYLDSLWIEYREDHTLFFPENYYTWVLWELEDSEWNIIGSGSRYDTLATTLWSAKPYPAAGFQIDVIQIIDLLKADGIAIKDKDEIDLYFVQLWDEAKQVVFPLSLEARARGINTQTSLWTPSMKEQMLKAQRVGAKYVVLVAVMEARSGVFQVRNMEDGTQAEVKKDDLIEYIIDKIGEENLDFYEPSRDLIQI